MSRFLNVVKAMKQASGRAKESLTGEDSSPDRGSLHSGGIQGQVNEHSQSQEVSGQKHDMLDLDYG